jgi:hypothetical protein
MHGRGLTLFARGFEFFVYTHVGSSDWKRVIIVIIIIIIHVWCGSRESGMGVTVACT